MTAPYFAIVVAGLFLAALIIGAVVEVHRLPDSVAGALNDVDDWEGGRPTIRRSRIRQPHCQTPWGDGWVCTLPPAHNSPCGPAYVVGP